MHEGHQNKRIHQGMSIRALPTEDGCDGCNYAVLVLLVAISLYAVIAVAVQGSENKHFIVVLPRLFNMRGSATNETVGIGKLRGF